MRRMGVRALAMAGAMAAFPMVGGSAQARGFEDTPAVDRVPDRVVRVFELHEDEGSRGQIGPSGPGPSVPEPSAALVFGVGLLVARGFARRRR